MAVSNTVFDRQLHGRVHTLQDEEFEEKPARRRLIRGRGRAANADDEGGDEVVIETPRQQARPPAQLRMSMSNTRC
jgi:hypothetical protein